METYKWIIWICLGIVVYTYIVYPLMVFILAYFRKRKNHPSASPKLLSISLILCVKNEQDRLPERMRELFGLLDAIDHPAEFLVVSDGSTDLTVELARTFEEDTRLKVLEIKENVGKAEALTYAVQHAQNEILVFCDVRQTWDKCTLAILLQNFSDVEVGAVTGELILEATPGVLAGVGLYWRYEKWLRRHEGMLSSVVGATGAISAVRRELFRPIPRGIILDDVYWPMNVCMQGKRVVHERNAKAYDRLPKHTRDEFSRKVRTLSGNFQLVAAMPAILIPWRNPVWWQFMSHKILRLVVPWLLIVLIPVSFMVPELPFRIFFFAQVFSYAFGLLGLWQPIGSRFRFASSVGSLLVLNAAAWVAFWVWISGRCGKTWNKVVYHTSGTTTTSSA